jgi:hypothetical protein
MILRSEPPSRRWPSRSCTPERAQICTCSFTLFQWRCRVALPGGFSTGRAGDDRNEASNIAARCTEKYTALILQESRGCIPQPYWRNCVQRIFVLVKEIDDSCCQGQNWWSETSANLVQLCGTIKKRMREWYRYTHRIDIGTDSRSSGHKKANASC